MQYPCLAEVCERFVLGGSLHGKNFVVKYYPYQGEFVMPLRDLYTKWGKDIGDKPLQEYPRPQFVRKSYINLNGWWEYSISVNDTIPDEYQGKILVPFSPESVLSGVGRQLRPKEFLFYRRSFNLPKTFVKDRVLLNFGAVDSICDIYINSVHLCHHEGGYNAFSVDITDAIKRESENELTVRVRDMTDSGYGTRGKQRIKRGGIWYAAQSGIWQTVWLESVPAQYIRSVKITPDFDNARVIVEPKCNFDEPVTVVVTDGEREIAKNDGKNRIIVHFPNKKFTAWTPEDPHLYGLRLISRRDIVDSYFGMRKFYCCQAGKYVRLMLNDKPYFHRGVLDQGYWSDGLYTAPSDEALIYDIQTAKDLGFNTIRKHVKVESARWYYHCDRLGMLVWQDMPCGGAHFGKWTTAYAPYIGLKIKDSHYALFGRGKQESRDLFIREYTEMIDRLYNNTSIAVWVPFNEGWGQFDANKIAVLTKQMDTTRIVDHASGWHDQGGGDVKSLHVYFGKVRLPNEKKRALCLTEFGGYGYIDEAHSVHSESAHSYRQFDNETAYNAGISELYEKDVIPYIARGLSAVIYTQLSDVEDEVNGLLTYDRQVVKVHADMMKEINSRLNLDKLADLLEQSKYKEGDHVPRYEETV